MMIGEQLMNIGVKKKYISEISVICGRKINQQDCSQSQAQSPVEPTGTSIQINTSGAKVVSD